MSICLTINSNQEYTNLCLDKLKENSFEYMELYCITDENNFNSIKNYLNDVNFPIFFKNDTKQLLDEINGEYILFLESSDWISIDLRKMYNIVTNNNIDIVYNYFLNDLYFTENIVILDKKEIENFSLNTYYKQLFELPKLNNNIYRVQFLKEKNVDIPSYSSFERLYFFFRTMFSTFNIAFVKESFVEKRFKQKQSLEENILFNFIFDNYEYSNNINVENFFNIIKKINSFFIEKNYFNNKYVFLNYLFNLFRKIYDYNLNNMDEYYSYLQKYVKVLQKDMNMDLLLNLDTDNLQFYKNIINSHIISEFNLLYKYQDLILKNEILRYEKEKMSNLLNQFMAVRFDIKNMGAYDNNVEIIDCDDSLASIYYPNWLKDNNGSGAIIQSMNGSIKFKIKCLNDGVLRLIIRGSDIKDINGHKLPIFIDLTGVEIDDDSILSKRTLINYDDSFMYELNVKHNEILNINVTWESMGNNSNYVFDNYEIEPFKHFFTGRIDVKNIGNKNNSVKIIEVSDSQAKISNPAWMKDSKGIGTLIQSESGHIEFKVKCHQAGMLQFNLRSMNYKDQNGARLPVFIDFRNFSINGDTIIKNALVHHDYPFEYGINVKHNEIVSVKAIWKPMSLYSEYTNKIHRRNSFKHFFMGRIDVKNIGNKNNSVKIIEVSDSQAKISNPAWMKDSEGIGTLIQSESGHIEFKVKCHHRGLLKFSLRTIDLKDIHGKRLPLYIDFTNFIVNGKNIKSNVLVHHDYPFEYDINVKHNEIVSVKATWKPLTHKSILK